MDTPRTDNQCWRRYKTLKRQEMRVKEEVQASVKAVCKDSTNATPVATTLAGQREILKHTVPKDVTSIPEAHKENQNEDDDEEKVLKQPKASVRTIKKGIKHNAKVSVKRIKVVSRMKGKGVNEGKMEDNVVSRRKGKGVNEGRMKGKEEVLKQPKASAQAIKKRVKCNAKAPFRQPKTPSLRKSSRVKSGKKSVH